MLSPQQQPTIQVRSKIAIMYNQYIGDRKKKENPSLQNFSNQEVKTYSGELKQHARKRLARAVSLLNQCSPWRRVLSPVGEKTIDFKLSFITLTFPGSEIIDGKTGYKEYLYPFLRIIKARYPGFMYVYKAELQERGQLHYHITSNECIPYQVIRQCWNKVLSAGTALDEFIAKYGHNAAPSTEIKSVQNIADIESYLVKYIAKEDPKGRTIGGKVWGCCKELQGRGYFSDVLNSVNTAAIEMLEKAGKAVVTVREKCTIVKLKEGSPLMLLSKLQYQAYGDYINNVINNVRELPRKFEENVGVFLTKAALSVNKGLIDSQLTLRL